MCLIRCLSGTRCRPRLWVFRELMRAWALVRSGPIYLLFCSDLADSCSHVLVVTSLVSTCLWWASLKRRQKPWRRIVTVSFHEDFRKTTHHNLVYYTMHIFFSFFGKWVKDLEFFARLVYRELRKRRRRSANTWIRAFFGYWRIRDRPLSLWSGYVTIAPAFLTSWRRQYGSMS